MNPRKRRTFSISLWDHEIIPDGGWSQSLAENHLDGSAVGLSRGELNLVLRKIRMNNWGDCSILVEGDE